MAQTAYMELASEPDEGTLQNNCNNLRIWIRKSDGQSKADLNFSTAAGLYDDTHRPEGTFRSPGPVNFYSGYTCLQA